MVAKMMIAFVGLTAFPAMVQSQEEGETGTWKVLIALVLEDLEVKPVPLHAFVLRSAVDTSFVIPGRTGLDGLAEGIAPSGKYRIISDNPARLNGVAYSWDVDFFVNVVGVSEMELTNINADVDSTISQELRATGRKLEDAVAAYRRVRTSVFRIESGAGHGTGFLVDSANGLVVTNAHVVEHQTAAYADLDSVTRIRATLLARDRAKDIAILQVASSRVEHLHPLPLARPLATKDIVEAGERVFAIGYPLNQEQTLTTGIVSSVRAGAIISDVNINPGNSGGPMLNYSAEVVGVNTFANVSESGPGISGAIVATEVWPVLESARLAMDTTPPPLRTLLPTMPLATYQLADLRSHSDTASTKRLKEYQKHDVGPFDLVFQTPPSLVLRAKSYDDKVAGDRRRREADAGVALSERYSSTKEYRDWYRFASDVLTPVVMLQVSPQVGETTGSFLTRALLSSDAQAQMKFKGDVTEVRLYRNGLLLFPIRGGTVPVEQYVDNRWVSLKDVANFGSYVYSPLAFAPDTLGTPPSMVIEVVDLKDDNKSRCRELPKKLVAYLWNDFLPFMRREYPESNWIVADRDRKAKKFTASSIPGDTPLVLEPKKGIERFGRCSKRQFQSR